jgi:hypothetical protein
MPVDMKSAFFTSVDAGIRKVDISYFEDFPTLIIIESGYIHCIELSSIAPIISPGLNVTKKMC